MKINVIIFGQLVEIMGRSNLTVSDISNTDQLSTHLKHIYPDLGNLNYAIAIDKKIIHKNSKLSNSSTVALLPPYSGG